MFKEQHFRLMVNFQDENGVRNINMLKGGECKRVCLSLLLGGLWYWC